MVCSLFISNPLLAEESYERFTERTWTYRDGTQATGKLIIVSGPEVTLKLEGKGTVRVPLEKLSVKDLNWIYEYHKRKKQLSFLPPQYRKPQSETPESKPEAETPKPAEMESKPDQPEKNMTAAEQQTDESYKPFTVRKWTLKDGTSHQAKLLSVSGQKVHILKDSGLGLQIELDKLSEQDVNWVVEYYRRNNLLSRLPAEYRDRAAKDLPATESMVKPSVIPMIPDLPKEVADKIAEQKAQMQAMAAAAKAKAAEGDDPDVVKANTEIDPILVAVLRDYRVWTDKKGQKSEAIFSRIDGREALFATRTAGFARVPIGTLIDEDLQLLRDTLKMHGRFDEMPLVYREPLDPNLTPIKLKQILRVNDHRKWTDLIGNSVGASYIKMEDGKVFLLITKTSAIQEFPYANFTAEDQEYVQERLKKEIPGNFFPAGVEGVELSLTPEEREKEFRIWTDRSNRQLKGKFDRLAYGNSVAVINTGKKEELFITEFFSDQDLSLIKPRKQKQTDQLAMNGNSNPGGMNRGIPGQFSGAMAGNSPFSNQNPNTAMTDDLHFKKRTFTCPLCNKSHQSESLFFSQCPHCGLKDTDTIYKCENCSRTFKTDFYQGHTAPCPYCNNKTPNNQVAFNNSSMPGAAMTREKMYTCEKCSLRFSADGHGNKAPCPKCNSEFSGNANFWAAIVKLIIVIVLASGGYYRFSR